MNGVPAPKKGRQALALLVALGYAWIAPSAHATSVARAESRCGQTLGANLGALNPLLEDLAFLPPTEAATKTSERLPADWALLYVSSLSLSNAERIGLIEKFPLRSIMAKPGHRVVRDPSAVLRLASSIEANGYIPAAVRKEFIELNIVTDWTGKLYVGKFGLPSFQYRFQQIYATPLPIEALDGDAFSGH